MNAATPWLCPSCRHSVPTGYCPDCGERQPNARELTLRGLFGQIVHALTSIDGKLLRSFSCLIRRPGSLTAAYLEGRRKPFLGPVALFLTANVLFFACESWLGGSVFTTPLDSHLQTQPWSPLAQALTTERLAALHTTQEAFAPGFDRAVALHARSMIIVMALSFALVLGLVFRGRKKPNVTHAVFALHLYAVLLLLLCVATLIPATNAWLGGAGFAWQALDHGIALTIVALCAVYIHAATAVVYGSRGIRRVIEAGVLAIGVSAIVLGYRFALFLGTLYTV